jgi:thiamine biosynthesis lipoprotein
MTKIQLETRTIDAMSLPFSIKFAITDRSSVTLEIIEKVTCKVCQLLQHIEQLFSPFDAQSEVSRYRQGQLPLWQTSPLFQEVFVQILKIQEITELHFNSFFDGAYNPTGFVKGWAIEKIHREYLAPLLKDPSFVASALIGGGDLQVATRKNHPFSWNIGIADPQHPQRIISSYQLKNGAIATSGFSKRGQHIQRSPRNIFLQATIVGQNLSVVDVWATVALSAPPAKVKTFINTQQLTGLLVQPTAIVTIFEQGGFIHA